MHKSTIRLADGRQLIYFDREPGADRSAEDKRDLPPLSAQSQLRHDVLQDEYVVVATHRQGRTHLPAADERALWPSPAGRRTEIPAEEHAGLGFDNRTH